MNRTPSKGECAVGDAYEGGQLREGDGHYWCSSGARGVRLSSQVVPGPPLLACLSAPYASFCSPSRHPSACFDAQAMYCSSLCRDADRCHVASGPECGRPWPRLVREETLLAVRLASIESTSDENASLEVSDLDLEISGGSRSPVDRVQRRQRDPRGERGMSVADLSRSRVDLNI